MAVSVVDYEFLGRINSRRPSLQESCLSIVPGLWERKLPDHPVDDSFFRGGLDPAFAGHASTRRAAPIRVLSQCLVTTRASPLRTMSIISEVEPSSRGADSLMLWPGTSTASKRMG